MSEPQALAHFAALLAAHAARSPDRIAMIDRDRSLSYAELDRQSRILAINLAALGVRRNDRVAVWLPNSHAWLLMFAACARLGAMVFAINTRFRAHEVEDIVTRGRVDWLALWPQFKGITFSQILQSVSADSLSRLRGLVCCHEAGEHPLPATLCGLPVRDFASLLAPAPRMDSSSMDAPDATLADSGALVFTTSGTTSLPKFVWHRQRTLIAHGHAIAACFGYDAATRVLSSTPFCGAFGFATLLGALVYGVTLVSDPVFDPAQATERVRAHRITHTYANDESITAMIAASASPRNFESVQIFGFSSFSPAQGELVGQAAAHGLTAAGLYGSSELNALAAIQPLDASHATPSYQGLPGGVLVVPEARVRSRDPDRGEILPHGTPGELEIYSPCAMAGYLDQPEATAKVFTEDGYFRTSDLGYTVNDRQFVFQSRINDSLRLSGFLVNPLEIEAVVDTLPGVQASQVVGAVDGNRTVPVAFVQLAQGARTDEHGWQDLCRKCMASYKVPARFVAIDEFPRVTGPNGTKIQRNRLREMAGQLFPAP